MKTFIIVAVFLIILWQLGAGLYYLMNDKGESNRAVKALTRRVAISVLLVLAIAAAHKMGYPVFHGFGK